MPEFLQLTEHLTEARMDQPIRETYLGQAHIAGTGPEGTTCRECIWWRILGRKRDSFGNLIETVKSPAYFGKKHETHPCELKKHKCTRPIMNKANRLIPHHAKSCRLFEAAENPPPAKRGPKTAA